MEETCTKHNRPIDCIDCPKRISFTSNNSATTIECKSLGKVDYKISIAEITHNKDDK